MKKTKFIPLGNIRDVGVSDIKQFLLNKQKIQDQIILAMKSGCHIEAISLRIQQIDFWLRILVNRNSRKNIPPKSQFGDILKKSKPYLSRTLYSEIHKFNEERVKAIHHFVLGAGNYSAITQASEKYGGLTGKVVSFILKQAKKTGPYFDTLPEATKPKDS